MRREDAHVVVIGGGPAGSTTAIALKQMRPDARVILVERVPFPRHHVGESTLPDANAVLLKLGVLDKIVNAGFVRTGGITYKWRDDRPIFSDNFGAGVMHGIPEHSWQVDRSRYDMVLLDHARESGVEVWQPCGVTQVVRDGDRVTGVVVAPAEGGPCTITCGHVVDCSGQARLLGRLLGIQSIEHELGDLAIYRYYQDVGWPSELIGSPEMSRIFFAAVPAGWVWYIPLARDLASVGVVTRRDLLRERDLDDVFEEQLAFLPELREPLRRARVVAPPGSGATDESAPADRPPQRRFTCTIQNWSYEHASMAGPGWYLAGDAAAFVDPILSSGILLGHRAGIAAANAIRTEWEHPEIAPERLRAAYQAFYEDMTRGFIVMASWWYNQRGTGTEDWWKRAAVLSRKLHPAVALDDIAAFMQFATGFVTDFRFADVGAGFGGKALSVCVDGITGNHAAGKPLLGGVTDRSCPLTRHYDRVDLEWYLATYVETDRWWDLPALRFGQGDRVQLYRPPVPWDQSDQADTALVRRAAAALLDSVDDQRCIDDVVQSACLRLGAEVQSAGAQLINQMAADLLSLGFLSAAGAPAQVGMPAKPLVQGSAVVSRKFERADVVWTDGSGLADGPPARLAEIVLASTGTTRRYRPPFGIRKTTSIDVETAARVVMHVIAACDGSASIDEVTRHTVSRMAGVDARLCRDLVCIVLSDLLSIEALSPKHP